MAEKFVKNGKVAVIISPGYGAGFSTWGNNRNEAGFNVVYSHKDDGQNFYDFGDGLFAQDIPDFDILISNPPFHNKALLVEKVIALGKPFALLLPMTWLNDSAPYRLFARGGVELMLFDRRIKFKNCGNQPSFGVGYYCRGILPEKIVFESLGV